MSTIGIFSLNSVLQYHLLVKYLHLLLISWPVLYGLDFTGFFSVRENNYLCCHVVTGNLCCLAFSFRSFSRFNTTKRVFLSEYDALCIRIQKTNYLFILNLGRIVVGLDFLD